MADIYHSGDFYVRGDVDCELLVQRVKETWRPLRMAEFPPPPMNRAFLSTSESAAREGVDSLLGGTVNGHLNFWTDHPWDEASRQVWGPASGAIVDELFREPSVTSWAFTCDEGHVVGYWAADGPSAVNTFIGGEGYSIREHFAYMLMDRFETHGVDYLLTDLGDLLGDSSTADEV